MIKVPNTELNRNLYMNEIWTLRNPSYIFIFSSEDDIDRYIRENLEEGEDDIDNGTKVSIIEYLRRLEEKIDRCKDIKYIDRYKEKCFNTKIIYIRDKGKRPSEIEIIGNTIYYYIYVDKKQIDRRPYVRSI